MMDVSTIVATTVELKENVTKNCSEIREDTISGASRNFYITTILFIYFVIGVVGNGILVVLFFKEKTLRDINNALITNLAFSDLLYVGVYVPILIFTEFYKHRPFGKKFCIISILVNFTSQDVSTLSLTALSYFRYCAIVTPFQSRRKSRSKLIFSFCVFSWLIGIIFAIFPANYCLEHPNPECFILTRHKLLSFFHLQEFRRFYYIRFAFLYLLPLFTIAYFYGRVAHTLLEDPLSVRCCRTKSDMKVSEAGQSNSQAKSRSRKKLSIVVLIIVVIFFVSWLPSYLYWFTALDDGSVIPSLNAVRIVTMLIPATTNPIIFLITSTKYRQGFLNICFCGGLKSTLTQGTTTMTTQIRTRLSVMARLTGNNAKSSSTRNESTFAMNPPEQI